MNEVCKARGHPIGPQGRYKNGQCRHCQRIAAERHRHKVKQGYEAAVAAGLV